MAANRARYQYNGLGHRQESRRAIQKKKLEKLDPQRRARHEIGNSRLITYTLDLQPDSTITFWSDRRAKSQRYFWDGNVAAYAKRMGKGNYYLRTNWGIPAEAYDSAGTIRELWIRSSGKTWYQNQGKMDIVWLYRIPKR